LFKVEVGFQAATQIFGALHAPAAACQTVITSLNFAIFGFAYPQIGHAIEAGRGLGGCGTSQCHDCDCNERFFSFFNPVERKTLNASGERVDYLNQI
jgi:hypothetical protein